MSCSTGRRGPSAVPGPPVEGVRGLGIEIRAGLQTGEIEVVGSDVGGLAVHLAARIAALASPSGGRAALVATFPP